jgi:hypothetical protein
METGAIVKMSQDWLMGDNNQEVRQCETYEGLLDSFDLPYPHFCPKIDILRLCPKSLE